MAAGRRKLRGRRPCEYTLLAPVPARPCLSIGAAVLLCSAVLTGCGKDSPPPAPARTVAPVQRVEIAGVGPYREALAAQDMEETLRLLEQAVRANPHLAEAWYELGRLKVKRAPDVVKTDELQAIAMFREGLESEREASRLLDEGRPAVWTPAQEEEAREVLARDLQNVGEVLADQESLLNALRMRTY
jgi:tetratricopeptide (TPR) repeat protein